MRRHAVTATNPAAGNPTASPAIATTASVVVPRARMIPTPSAKNNNATTTRMPAGREKNLREQHDDPDGEQDQGEGQVVHVVLSVSGGCECE